MKRHKRHKYELPKSMLDTTHSFGIRNWTKSGDTSLVTVFMLLNSKRWKISLTMN